MENSEAVQNCLVGVYRTTCDGYVIPDFYPVTAEQVRMLQPQQLEIMEARQNVYANQMGRLATMQVLFILAVFLTGLSIGAIISYIRYVGCGATDKANRINGLDTKAPVGYLDNRADILVLKDETTKEEKGS